MSALASEPELQVRATRLTEPIGPDEPIVGCGKAQAALRQFARPIAGERMPGDIAYAAAMSDTDVHHYDLDIEISSFNSAANTCWLAGTNRMIVESRSVGLTEFLFRLRSNYTITNAVLNDTLPVTVDALSTSTRRVTLDRIYGIGETFTLTVDYSGWTDSGGMGSIEVDSQFDGTPIVSTLSEPYFAYSWWPVKDGDVWEPGDNSDKVTINFSMTVPNTMQVAANGTLTGVDMIGLDRQQYHWETNYPIAPYLVSFGATAYNTWTEPYVHPGGEMPVKFYIYPTWDSAGNRAAWNLSVDMLGTYAAVFGEYPFINEKYGIYNFSFGGGMEHQTMTGQGGFGEALTAHELAHQWFGDAITCKTWSDIWLNEGFAEYSECLWEEFKSGTQDPVAYKFAALSRKPSNTTTTVYVPPAETANVNRIFNYTTTYLKGAWVLHQLRHVVGDEAFFDFLLHYRTTYEGGAVDTEEFIATANAFFGYDLHWFFDQWIYAGGGPRYQFGWNSIDVGGKRYLRAHIEQYQQAAPLTFVMPIDLHVQTTTGTTVVQAFNDQRSQWFAFPVNGTPLSVSFDPDNWVLNYGFQEVPYVPGPPKVVDLYPPAGEAVPFENAIDEVRITMLEPVTVTSADIEIVGARVGSVGFTMTSGSPTSEIVLQMDHPLDRDAYTVRVFDSVVGSATALALDGEVPGSGGVLLPTGDGVAGGTAEIPFRVLNNIPATSTWGLAVFAIVLLTAGTILTRRATHAA